MSSNHSKAQGCETFLPLICCSWKSEVVRRTGGLRLLIEKAKIPYPLRFDLKHGRVSQMMLQIEASRV
jgi:hypothetical protein